MLSYRFALRKEDYENYTVFVYWGAPGARKAIIRRLLPSLLVITFILGLVYFPRLSSGNIAFTPSIILIPAVMIGVPLFSYFNTPNRLRRQAEKFCSNPENSGLLEMTNYQFSEAGIFVSNEYSETKLQWKAIVKKLENDAYYFLFRTGSSALVIPKKILRSPAEKEELEKLFASYISFNAEVGHLVNN